MERPNNIEKIAVKTNIIKRGLKKLQSIPNTESLYLEVKSLLTNSFNKNFFSANVSNIFSTVIFFIIGIIFVNDYL